MKKIFLLLILSLSCNLSWAQDRIDLTKTPLPALELVESWAFKNLGLQSSQIQDWKKGARWSAALPRLQVGWESEANQQNTNIIQDSISVTSAGITVGPESNRLDQDLGNHRNFEVRAVWSFPELLFNPDQLSISRETRDLYLVRSRVIEEVQQAYYAIKTQLLEFQYHPELAQDPIQRLKLEQGLDRLNSLSGGELKRFLKNSGEKANAS